MSCDKSIKEQMYDYVRSGQLQKVEELIDKYGLSYCSEWSNGYILLRKAVKYKHRKVAKFLIKRGAKIYSRNQITEMTPFNYAIKNGDTEIVEMLLQKNVGRGLNISKYLHHPVEYGNIKIVKALLQHGADVNFLSEFEGNAPLHIATEKNNKNMVLLLLSNQANVNIRENHNSSNLTPLHIASDRGYLEIVEVLLNHGALVNSDDYNNCTPLHRAVDGKHKDVVELLLRHGAKVDPDDNNSKTILCCAVETRCIELVEIVLKYLPNVDKENNRTALITALCDEKIHPKIVEVLIQYGFSIKPEDAKNCELLHKVIGNGYLNVVNDLIAFGADVNMSFCERYSHASHTPLETAVVNNRLEIFQILVKHGANVKINNDLLHIAVEKCYLDMIHLLLQHYTDANAKDKHGKTPLYIAVEGMSKRNKFTVCFWGSLVKLLLSKGANANTQTAYQGTALITASEFRQIEAVKALLEYGADVNAKIRGREIKMSTYRCPNLIPGVTALHVACRRGCGAIVKVLIKYGADVNITNSLGQTPLEYAEERSDIIGILERQFVRIQTANLYLNAKNNLSTEDNPQLKAFQNRCEEEIVRAKETKISDSNISFYDFLAKDNNELAICMKNYCVEETLKSNCYKQIFPIYRYMIHNNMKKAFERKQLMEQCVEIFPTLIFQELLPECVEKILSFFSNDDLKNLIKDHLT